MNNTIFSASVNKSVRSLAVAALVGSSIAPVSAQKQNNHKPNILFILVDDMGWKDVGFMGSDFYETPNIDKLSKEGVVFTNAYANAPNCAPSRACLLSGQYGPRHGVYTVNSSARGKAKNRKLIPTTNTTELNGNVITVAEALKEQGYSTCMIGKWHMGQGDKTGPMAQGFDVNIGGGHQGHPKTYFGPFHMKNLENGPSKEYLTDRLTDEALGFMKSHKEGPFFLYLSHYSVHTPLQAKADMIEKYRGKKPGKLHNHPTYAAMVESTDQSVGRLMKGLDEMGIAENTLVVFFSDNGGFGPVTSMAPLKGSKGMMYEGGIREPLIVRWPNKIKKARKCDVPVIGTDFYPSFLEVAGVTDIPERLDGESLIPLLKGKVSKLKKRSLFWHFPAYLEAYRGMKSPLGCWRTTPASAIRKGKWKLIEYFEDHHLELYDLKNDLGENHNMAKRYPRKLKELYADLKKWREDVKAPVPQQRNSLYEGK